MNSLLCTSVFSHIKGHQDEALYAFCKTRSPLLLLTHFNIEMDKLTDQECSNTGIQPTMPTVFQSSKIALIINSSVVTSNVKEEINYAMKYTPLHTYIYAKRITGHLKPSNWPTGHPLPATSNPYPWLSESRSPNWYTTGKILALKKNGLHGATIARSLWMKTRTKLLANAPCNVESERPHYITFIARTILK